jgi:SSS family solute:Na+ symporter
LITLVILAYTLRGGLKAVAWTDVLQGLIMLALMIAALALVVSHLGGWSDAFQRVLHEHPRLMSRPGGRGTYGPAVWFSFMALWFFCDPMFPQLFQRFYAAKSDRSLARTALYYPAICTVVFTLPIALGLLGRLLHPGLGGQAADNIVPLLMTSLGGDVMGTLVLAAGLAALMSTMDSQLLTLSSIFTRDIYPLVSGGRPAGALVGRVFVAVLALAGWILAMSVDTTILQLGLTAFTGLAVLFPTVLFGLYLRKPSSAAGLASIIGGEALVIAYHLKIPPTFGFLPAVPVMAFSTLVYLAVQALAGSLSWQSISRRASLALAGLGLIFLAAQDYWRWGQVGGLWLGWPIWAWYFVGLSALQTLVMAWWVRASLLREN